MARERLTGEDAKLAKGSLSTATADTVAGTSDGEDITTEGWYLVNSVNYSTDVTTGLPTTNLKAGHLCYLTTSDTITESSSGSTNEDNVTRLIAEDLCDIYSWSLSASRSEFDVTTFCDETMSYEYGKTDLTGSLSGIRRIGITDVDGGVINNFYDVISVATGGTHSVYDDDNSEIYLQLYEQKEQTAGETESFFFVKAKIGSYEPTADLGSRQEFTANFRVTGGIPALYQRSH